MASQASGTTVPDRMDAMNDTKDTTYNGWTNWATWAVTLWARNDESNYRQWLDAPRDAMRARMSLADFLRDTYEDTYTNGDMDPSDYADVDWDAVAAACEEEHE